MWSPDRRRLLALLAATLPAGAAACGFRPAYGPGAPAEGLRDRVAADPPVTRNDFDFVAAIEDSLGRSADPAYRLGYRIDVQVISLAVTPDGSILRYNYVGNVAWLLRDAATGATLAQGSTNSFTASAATRSTIAAAASETDATVRLMQILADQVVTQLLAGAADQAYPA
jgi:LPS-assembly lipoprotein